VRVPAGVLPVDSGPDRDVDGLGIEEVVLLLDGLLLPTGGVARVRDAWDQEGE
jgi:hypothetical protein